MREVLASLKPYYYYLVSEGIKEIEVRKTIPKAADWNRDAWFYMSKDEKSFAKIPKEYQEKYRKHFGKVGLKFVCDKITDISVVVRNCNEDYNRVYHNDESKGSCLTWKELQEYGKGKTLYGWHITDLKIYDKTKELSEFKKAGFLTEEEWLFKLYPNTHCHYEAWAKKFDITRPPQSWCYVEVE